MDASGFDNYSFSAFELEVDMSNDIEHLKARESQLVEDILQVNQTLQYQVMIAACFRQYNDKMASFHVELAEKKKKKKKKILNQ